MEEREAVLSEDAEAPASAADDGDTGCDETPDDEHLRTAVPRLPPAHGWECREGSSLSSTALARRRRRGLAFLGCAVDDEEEGWPPQNPPGAFFNGWGRSSAASSAAPTSPTLPAAVVAAAAAAAVVGLGTAEALKGHAEPPSAPGRPGEPLAAPKGSASAGATAAAGNARGFSATSCGRPLQEAAPANQKEKCRTLKYYPPPSDDTDAVSVDVIDHGSEVLIVRREPSPMRGCPSTSVLLGTVPSRLLRPPPHEKGLAAATQKVRSETDASL